MLIKQKAPLPSIIYIAGGNKAISKTAHDETKKSTADKYQVLDSGGKLCYNGISKRAREFALGADDYKLRITTACRKLGGYFFLFAFGVKPRANLK